MGGGGGEYGNEDNHERNKRTEYRERARGRTAEAGNTLIPVFAGRQIEGDSREAGEEGGKAWWPSFGWASRDATDGGHPQQLP